MNKYGETVVFDRDLNIPYDPALIDSLRVYNRSLGKFDSCEHWGWNDEGEDNLPFHDFGKIADFHFDIYKDKTRLFHASGLQYGYLRHKPSQLIVLTEGIGQLVQFIPSGIIHFEQQFPFPATMFLLAAYIDRFLAYRQSEIEKLKLDHTERFMIEKNQVQSKLPEDNGLPF